MRRLLGNIDYDDIQDIESNSQMLKGTLLSLKPKEIYLFMMNVKKKKSFYEKRARTYRKLSERSGMKLWSQEIEDKKFKEDRRWMETYDDTYDDPHFWYDLWNTKEALWYSKPFRSDDFIITPIVYEDVDDLKAISMEEYLIRCIELVFLTLSIIKIVKHVGKLLLSDERILCQLALRNNIQCFKTLVECGLLNDAYFTLGHRNNIVITTGDDDDSSNEIMCSCMQNVFYMLEYMKKKEKLSDFRLMSNPKNILTAAIPSRFPLKSRLYASAFVESVASYTRYRCGLKKDLFFLPKPFLKSDDKDGVDSFQKPFMVYDLEHNIIFDNVALFFKYNMYTFKQNADAPVFETLCLYDDESEIINSCIEFGFENIMEFEVLEQMINKDLTMIDDRVSTLKGIGKKETKNNVEWQRWTRLFGSKTNDLKTISVLPCAMRTDEDLLTKDGTRLGELRSILETRLVGSSRFPKTLSYLLHLSIVDLQSDVSGNYNVSSPEALRWFFVKKKFIKTLYDKLTNEEWTTRNEIVSLEKLDGFLTEHAPFITYETIEIDIEDLSEYLRFVEDDEIERELYETMEDEEEMDTELERRATKKIRSSDLLISKSRDEQRTSSSITDGAAHVELDDLQENYYYYDEQRLFNQDENGEVDEGSLCVRPPSNKRKRMVKLVISNVHKDCFLFNDSFYVF